MLSNLLSGITVSALSIESSLNRKNKIFVTFQSQYLKNRLKFLLRYSSGGTKIEKIFDVDGN